MGIFCQINLFKPPNGVYYPGSTVSGIIKYAVDEITVFDKITVSLKGYGLVDIKVTYHRNGDTYKNKETYVDVDDVSDNEKAMQHDIGMYERRFDFVLPYNIPNSLKYKREYVTPKRTVKVKCKIKYYIRIKFEKPGFFGKTNRFKKDLNIECGIKPILPTEPIIYGEQNKLFKPFTSKDCKVNVKAVMKNSVITPGQKIEFGFEIANDTDLTVKGVKTKLIEVYTFKSSFGGEYKMDSDIDNTDSQTGSIHSGEKKHIDFNIEVPSDVRSLGFSKIMSRDYFVKITADLPFPRRDVVLEMPVEIGEIIQDGKALRELKKFGKGLPQNGEGSSKHNLIAFRHGDEFGGSTSSNVLPSSYDDTFDEGVPMHDPPPSYWEAMGEDTDDEDFETKS